MVVNIMALPFKQCIVSRLLEFAAHRIRVFCCLSNRNVHIRLTNGQHENVRPCLALGLHRLGLTLVRPRPMPGCADLGQVHHNKHFVRKLYVMRDINYRKNLLINIGAKNICSLSTNLCVRNEIPGEEVLLKNELEKLKNQTGLEDGQSYDKEYKKLIQNDTKRRRAMKYATAAKHFPKDKRRKRQLTWDSIEQIQFLRQEHPEEWSTVHLAESFNVPEWTIKKVLKSKFVPNSRQRYSQDQLALGISVDKEKIKPPPENIIDQKVSVQDGNVLPPQSISKEWEESSPGSGSHKDKLREEYDLGSMRNSGEVDRLVGRNIEEREFGGDESLDLEEELEEAEAFSSLELLDFEEACKEENAPPKMIQKGREFYDADGEFLFKI